MQQKMESFMKIQHISVDTKNQLGWVDSLADDCRKWPFSPNATNFLATRGPKIPPTWPKSKSIVNNHSTSVDTKSELYCVNAF